MRIVTRLFIVLGLFLTAGPAVVAVASGCSGAEHFDCPGFYDPNRIGLDGKPDACCQTFVEANKPCPPPKDGGSDATASDGGPPTDASTCTGTCVPLAPAGWWGPMLFALAPAGSAPSCPVGTTSALDGYHGAADLAAGPITCPSCSCGSPDGACEPPTTITASNSPCAGADGGTIWQTPFDPPPNWDGTCTTAHAIPAGSCPTCVKSVTVAPLTITGNCPPITGSAPPPPAPSWASDVVACEATAEPCDAIHVCAASASAPFRQCIYAPGDSSCPAGWAVRELVASDTLDERGCSPCACGAVEGASCTGTIGLFHDSACTSLQLVTPIDSTTGECFDVTPGAALGSKSLTGLKFTLGACAPNGGEPEGDVTPAGLGTFCCRPGDAP